MLEHHLHLKQPPCWWDRTTHLVRLLLLLPLVPLLFQLFLCLQQLRRQLLNLSCCCGQCFSCCCQPVLRLLLPTLKLALQLLLGQLRSLELRLQLLNSSVCLQLCCCLNPLILDCHALHLHGTAQHSTAQRSGTKHSTA